MAYRQEGRAATVYKILGSGDKAAALKVFKTAYRKASLAGQAPKLKPFSTLPGLKVCKRIVLSPLQHGDLINQHPDLLYAIVMPWIHGVTWHDIIMQKKPITPEQSLHMARSLAKVLTGMEEQGIAHCDISAANVLLPGLNGETSMDSPVELVDVEQLYASNLQRPDPLVAGSPGYLMHTSDSTNPDCATRIGALFGRQPKKSSPEVDPASLWNPFGDRFAGAVLLAEILGWYDERVRAAAYESSYFKQDEIQTDSERYQTLRTVLEERWGSAIATRFSRIWQSQSLVECPLFADWLVSLPVTVPEYKSTGTSATQDSATGSSKDSSIPRDTQEKRPPHLSVDELIALAHDYERRQDWRGAIRIYRQALDRLPADSGLQREIQGMVQGLEHKLGRGKGAQPWLKKHWRWLLASGMAVLAAIVWLIAQGWPPTPVNPTATSVVVLQQPTATETPVPATDTPRPTDTATPRPTPTPRPTSTSTPKPTSVPSSAMLYSEDFEDGAANSWDVSLGEWTIEEESGNYFWSGTGPNNYPQVWLDDEIDPSLDFTEWVDYAFEVRVRFPKPGTLFMCARAEGGTAFYNVSLDGGGDWVQFAEYDGTEVNDGSDYQTFGGVNYDVLTNRWYTVRFELEGNWLSLYINDKSVTSAYRGAWDNGGIGFYMGGGHKIDFDDIRVWSLTSREIQPTATATPDVKAVETMEFTAWNASKEEFTIYLCGPSRQQIHLPPCTYDTIRIPAGIYGWSFDSQCSVPDDPSRGIGSHGTSLCIYPNDDGSARGTSTAYYCGPGSDFWSWCEQ